MVNGWFITGTDTGVGKTRAACAVLAAAVSLGWRALGMKPVASGCHVENSLSLRERAGVRGSHSDNDQGVTIPSPLPSPGGRGENFSQDRLINDDAEALMRVANVEAPYADVNPYAFAPAIAPHLAARAANRPIELDVIRRSFSRLADKADCIVVEGAGGWLVPISAQQSMADVAATLGLPVILVVGMRLGCLNHALLTQAAIAASGLVCAGWIANRLDPTQECFEENLETLKERLHAPLLAVFPHRVDAASDPSTLDELRRALVKSEQTTRMK